MPEVIYNPNHVWPVVFDAIARGHSLTAALKELSPSPSYSWAKKSLRNNPDLQAAYEAAQQDRADALAEQIIELADTPMPPELEGADKSAWVQQLRLRVDARKWTAAKLHSRRWGERVDVSVTETRISITAALAEAERRVLIGQRVDEK